MLTSLSQLPSKSVAKSSKKFYAMVEALEGVDAEDIAFDSKYRKTIISKRTNLYSVVQLDADGKAKALDHYDANKFEENFRWYI